MKLFSFSGSQKAPSLWGSMKRRKYQHDPAHWGMTLSSRSQRVPPTATWVHSLPARPRGGVTGVSGSSEVLGRKSSRSGRTTGRPVVTV